MNSRFATFLLTAVMCTTVGISSPVKADDLDISQTPLFVAVNVPPNIMFTMDDSGSMHWEVMPDALIWSYFVYPRPENVYSDQNYDNWVVNFQANSTYTAFLRSSVNNATYYDPSKTYRPWVNADGQRMSDASPAAALHNPVRPALGSRNLTTDNTQTAFWDNCTDAPPWDGDSNCTFPNESRTFWPALYYYFNGGDRWTYANYSRVEIRPSQPVYTGQGRENRENCALSASAVCTYDEEIQNFANWYTYHRSRILTARAGIGAAFDSLPSQVRVGYGAINADSDTIDGVETQTVVRGVRPFDSLNRQAFYDLLYDRDIPSSSTPLRRAAKDVGEYFSRPAPDPNGDPRGPWSTTPGEDGGVDLACRQSYHILMTDGFWNGTNPDVGNSDNVDGTIYTDSAGNTFGYVASDPFRDNRSNTLADVAMEYWKNDLRPDLANRVPTNATDPAFWQHLTSYGIGLGVQGNLDPAVVFQAVEDGTPVDWGDPFVARSPAKIDDLLHFGINGRGGFFSAADPETFAQELGAILADIAARANSTTGVSVSATRLTTDSLIYAAEFDSEGWTGELTALNADDSSVERRASQELATMGAANRNILTYDPASDSGAVFEPTANIETRVMDNAPVGYAPGTLFNYLRGDLSAGAGTFRTRDSMLGDIVNSRPRFSGPGNEGWARIDTGYLSYIDGPKRDSRDPCFPAVDPCPGSRRNTVFVGSNGGMLHAFDARTLEEHFAYVPAAVHGHLWELANPNYSHRFYVDGQIAVADAQRNGNWSTILVGTLGVGGRGIYALDVTQPQNFSENDVLWEFTSEDDSDLGFTFGEPLITRLEDGTWVAVFGNGYNSEDNRAYLYVVDLINGPAADGSVLHKIPLGAAGSNGLSGVAGWRDAATRNYIDRIYAGDLNGTVWRVDFDGGVPNVVYNNGLFTDPNNRPITATPAIAANPGGGLNIFVGTGKLIENDDRLTTIMDRFFSIRDRNSAIGGTGDMSVGTISAVTGEPQFRAIENPGDGEDGWLLNLALGAASGERIMAKALVQFGVLIIASYEPVEDPCTPGGIQRLYVLDALTGNGALPFCQNCGGIEVGIGAPISPPIVIKQHQRNVADGTIDFPGIPNPNEPEDPAAPPDAGGDPLREDWCSVYGIPPVVEGTSFLQLGTICEGRQVWLQRQ